MTIIEDSNLTGTERHCVAARMKSKDQTFSLISILEKSLQMFIQGCEIPSITKLLFPNINAKRLERYLGYSDES